MLPRIAVIGILVLATFLAAFVDLQGDRRTPTAVLLAPHEPLAAFGWPRRSTDRVAAVQTQGMQLMWRPGGVQSLSHAQTLAKMRMISRSVLDVLLGRSGGPNVSSSGGAAHGDAAAMCGVASDVKQLAAMLDPLTRAMVHHAVEETDDCLYHIAPHHRALCAMIYAMDSVADAEQALAESARGGGAAGGSLWEGVFQQSLCANFMTCMGWARGRLQVVVAGGDGEEPQNLSAAMLDSVFEHHVRPVLERRPAGPSSASSPFVSSEQLDKALLGNFLHGEGNWAVMEHLPGRHAAMRLDIDKRDRITEWKLEQQAPRKRIPISGPGSRLKPVWRRRTPVSDIFQGAVIDFDTVREQWAVAQQDKAVANFLPSFSPLELLAILHRVAHPGGAVDEDSSKAPMRLVVFHGDSTVRELYHRLIHHLRYGLATRLEDAVVLQAPTNGSASATMRAPHALRIRRPFYDLTYHGDSIFSVFENYDTLTLFNDNGNRPSSSTTSDVNDAAGSGDENATNAAATVDGNTTFESPSTVPRSNNTSSDAADITAHLRRLRQQGNRDTNGVQALLHIAFLWDTHGSSYRNEPLVHVGGLPNSARGRWNRSTLREEGFGIALHVQGATQWEAQRDPDMMLHWAAMATAAAGPTQWPRRLQGEAEESILRGGAPAAAEPDSHDLLHALRNATIDGPQASATVRRNGVVAPPVEQDATLVYMLTASLQDKMAQNRMQHLAPQRGFRRLPKPFPYVRISPDHNETLLKNELHLAWLQQVDRLRDATRNATGDTSSRQKFVRSIKILDKAKLSYLPSVRSYDRFHMSCRCDKIFFDHLFRPTITVARLYLLTASLLHPTMHTTAAPPAPNTTSVGGGSVGAVEVADYDICQVPNAPVRAGRTVLLDLIRKAEWVFARKRSYFHRVMLRAAHRGGNGLPFHRGKDYCGVVDSSDGCADHGDFGLLQLLAFDVGQQSL